MVDDKETVVLSETMRFIVITSLRIATACTLYRLVMFVVTLSMDESMYNAVVDFIVIFGMTIATIVLFLVRTYDWIRPCELCVYELNKTRVFYDAMFIVLTILSGTPNTVLLDIYMFVAIVVFIYDMIVNIMLTVAPMYCLKTFDSHYLRLHCYTFNNYFLCLCKTMSDEYNKRVLDMRKEGKL